MPATRERVLHLMLSEFDSTVAAPISPPQKMSFMQKQPRGRWHSDWAAALAGQSEMVRQCHDCADVCIASRSPLQLGAFLQVPGPFSGTTRKVDLSGELMEAGLVSWFWLHNKETAQSIAPRFPWSSWFGLSRQPMNGLREYFGSRIAWHFLYLNFLARWMLVPALASSAYAYVRCPSSFSTTVNSSSSSSSSCISHSKPSSQPNVTFHDDDDRDDLMACSDDT